MDAQLDASEILNLFTGNRFICCSDYSYDISLFYYLYIAGFTGRMPYHNLKYVTYGAYKHTLLLVCRHTHCTTDDNAIVAFYYILTALSCMCASYAY